MSKSTCPMLARSDWGVGSVQQKGLSHTLSRQQSPVGFHGPKTAGWLVFLNGAHRGEDIRVPIGDSKVGSSWTSDVVLTGPGVGSLHMTLRMGAGEASVIPAAANRDVRVDNIQVNGPTVLTDGCLLTIGDLHCIVRFAVPMTPGYQPPETAKPLTIASQPSPKVMTCGWLIVTRGPLMGQDFRLINGLNRIGSGIGLEVSIADQNLIKEAIGLDCSVQKGCILKSVSDGRAVKVNGSVCELGKQLRDSDVLAVDHLEMLLKWY